MASEAVVLTVYVREGCHLCDLMMDELQCFRDLTEFYLEVIDVDSDDEVKQRFGVLVPLLMGGKEEICRYFFNYAAVNAYLGNIR